MENKDVQIAMSFLDDVERSIKTIISEMNIPEAEHALESLLGESGTVTLLEHQIAKLESAGIDASAMRVRYLGSMGKAATMVASQNADIATPGDAIYTDCLQSIDRWGNLAVKWLTEAHSLEDGTSRAQLLCILLGNAYETLGRTEDAREAYASAEAGADSELAVRAAKAMAILDAKPERPKPKSSTGGGCAVIPALLTLAVIVALCVR